MRNAIDDADAILIGAGAGLSTSAGLTYSGERFRKYFGDFADKYGIRDIYSGGFYPFEDEESYWAWWSRHIYYNRYDVPAGKPYLDLLALVEGKNYFVLTTNVDHQFRLAGCDKARLFYTQGDYGLFQCSVPCCEKTFDNEQSVRAMVAAQRDMRVPSELIPRCPVCGAPVVPNLRSDDKFVEDEGWHAAASRYEDFVQKYGGGKLVLLELGVGANTPGIIKFPFWRIAAQNKNALYCCVNKGEAFAPDAIADRAVCLDADIGEAIADIARRG